MSTNAGPVYVPQGMQYTPPVNNYPQGMRYTPPPIQAPKPVQKQVGGWYNGVQYWPSGTGPSQSQPAPQQAPQQQSQQQDSYSAPPAPAPIDPIEQARKLQEFMIQQNQPAIQSLEASKTPLIDRYKSLIETIKGNQKVSEDRATLTTARELGRRGITGGGLYDQSITDALNPVTQQYTGLIKESQSGQETDLASIANQIASLQSGNAPSSIQSALEIDRLNRASQQFATDQAFKQQGFTEQQRQFGINQANAMKTGGSAGNEADIIAAIRRGGSGGTTGGVSAQEPRPTSNPGRASGVSPKGQWFWDYGSTSWIPIVN